MPELSRFRGIVIRMFAEAGGKHHTPHFHAYYSDMDAVYAFDPVVLLDGTLPPPQARLVEAWAALRRAELHDAWSCVDSHVPPQPITPLR